MSTIKEISTYEEWTAHTTSLPKTTTLIISFHTEWAAPCAQMSLVLKSLAADYPVTSPPTTSWVSLDAESLTDITEKYEISMVPFLVIERDGQVLEKVSGSSAIKVRAAVEKHVGKAGVAGEDGAGLTASSTAPEGVKGTIAGSDTNGRTTTATTTTTATSKEDLNKRLAELVKAAKVMLFMKGTPSDPQCGFSRQLVAILREHSVKYGFFNILADDEVRQGLKEFADWPTFPQLWMDGELVGGLDIVKDELKEDPNYLEAYGAKAVATA